MGRLMDANREALAQMRTLISESEGRLSEMKRICDGLAGDGDLSDSVDGASVSGETSMALAVDRRLHETFERLKLEILPMSSPTPAAGQMVYVLKDFFTTELGSWEVGQNWEFGLPQWARDAYLKPYGDEHYFDDAGGDHHLFGAVLDEYGHLMPGLSFTFAWPDGESVREVKQHSCWANEAIYSKYNPDAGERGSWSWWPNPSASSGTAGYVEGIGGASLPFGRHVSFFAVWQRIEIGGQ